MNSAAVVASLIGFIELLGDGDKALISASCIFPK
jgi:hypothetical protein